MSKPTDTNQASEDNIREFLRNRISNISTAAEDDIIAIIRTEKLKLLAEVREQIKAGGYEASYEISVVDKLEAEL